MQKTAKTYPLTYDAIIGTGGPGKLTGQQAGSLNKLLSKTLIAATVTGKPDYPVADAALGRFGQLNPKGIQQDLTATLPITIPETKRRLLGLLAPKIPFTSPLRAALRDTGEHGNDIAAGFISHDGLSDEDQDKAMGLVTKHYIDNLRSIGHNQLGRTNAARRNSPREYMDRMMQPPEEFIPRLRKQATELSFDWAKSGSWEQFESELDRVLTGATQTQKVALDNKPVAYTGGGDYPTATSKPSIPGDFLSGLHSKATGGMSSLGIPNWAHNPLIGAGIGAGVGALGGLLTDKRKGRGALQGVLLGGGLGALGGVAYNQFGGTPANDTIDPNKIPALPAKTTGGGESGWFDKYVKEPAASVVDAAGSGLSAATTIGGHAVDALKATGETGAGVGAIMAGRAISRSATDPASMKVYNRADLDPNAGAFAQPHVKVAPTGNINIGTMQKHPDELDNVIRGIAGERASKNLIPPNINASPEQAAINMQQLKATGNYGVGQRLYDSTVGRIPGMTHKIDFRVGDTPVSASRPELIAERNRQLSLAAGQPLKPQDAALRGNMVRKGFGGITQLLGGALTAKGVLDGASSLLPAGASQVARDLGPLTANQDSGNVLIGYIRSHNNDPGVLQQVRDYMSQRGWGTKWQNYVNDQASRQ